MTFPNNFDSLHAITSGKHLYQFYKNSEDFLHVMIPYFDAGLAKGEACLWLVSKRNGFDLARDTAEAMIPSFSAPHSLEQFQILPAEDWYLTEGVFDEAKAVRNAGNYLERVLKLGFSALRIAGDAGAVSRNDRPQFEAYERKIMPWIKGRPVIALCAYPILECTPSQAKTILECHEDVLVGHF